MKIPWRIRIKALVGFMVEYPLWVFGILTAPLWVSWLILNGENSDDHVFNWSYWPWQKGYWK